MGNNFNFNIKNKRQEIETKVIGVLNKNNKIRENLLNRNIGIYKMSELKDSGIGYISDIYSNESSKPTSLGEYGLLGYTHFNGDNKNNISEYQQKINNTVYYVDKENYYSNKLFEKDNTFYDDYTRFINDVIGSPITTMGILTKLFSYDKTNQILRLESDGALAIQRVLTDFVQYDNMKFALEKTRIGTVTPNPFASLAGSVITNINNFSGTDTKLGLLTNYIYAHTLKQAAQFNSIRRTPYITPEVYSNLGNKLNTLALLSAESRIDPDTGRISNEFGQNYMDTKSYEDISINDFESLNKIDNTRDIANSRNALYINLIRNLNLYTPFEDGNKYDSYNDIKLLNSWVYKTAPIKTYLIWNEGESKNTLKYSPDNKINNFDTLNIEEENSLLYKTQKLFNSEKNALDTLISRYHTDNRGRDNEHNKVGLLQTAISKYGLSHGRNLLSKNAYLNDVEKDINGYKSPYARVWTNRNQYDNVKKLIRSFKDDDDKIIDIDKLQKKWKFGRTEESVKKLKDKTVLNKNGFVNIAPTDINEYQKTMFSIENLAWNDSFGNNKINPEQIGPNGGRIMWFPPYDIKFNENINVDWNPNSFIGRGEKIYTYTNTERSGTLSFIMLVDHPSILDAWKKNNMDENDKEENLLRFFAGCDILEIDGKIKKNNYEEYEDTFISVDVVEEDNSFDDVCYAFFPYCYSGIDEKEIIRVHNNLSTFYESNQDYQTSVQDDEYKKEQISYYGNINNKLNFDKDSVRRQYSDMTITCSELLYQLYNKTYPINDISSIIIQGVSSSCENKKYKKNKLNKNRSKSIKSIFSSIYKIDKDKIIEASPLSMTKEDITFTYNSINDKKDRCVKIVIRKKPKKEISTEEMTENENIIIENNNNKNISKKERRRKEREERRENKKREKQSEKDYKKEIKDLKKELKNTENFVLSRNIEEEFNVNYETFTSIMNSSKEVDIIDEENKLNSIYNEYEYFSHLQENDSILYSRIIDKIKYFTPAFHSMTPEGFNARLGFLHQCTRQGATSAASEGGVAGNMAFGRPPICVLRIGDFYYTKIIIESITIEYDNQGMQWDMNPEGIGLQPLFARISLNFKFLGGSDLTGPISVLQNALSFNYYANQGIYDNRSIENK